MSAPTPPAAATNAPRYPGSVYWWGAGLAVILVGLLMLNSRQCFFRTALYEYGDPAANSLFVREAKSHFIDHGHYSRWGFFHPGPVLFYDYALGEAICYDLLHVTPTPYNGQVIGICVTVTLLFSLSLLVFAQRLGPARGGYAFFLPLALLFAVWHYGTPSVVPAFFATWPACPLILVFLCFVVATASVASGSGRELPLVAFTGGWLVHNHVAQPLFVVPMTLVAYGGLLAACRHAASPGPTNPRGLLTAGWRVFPRAHLVAVGVLALFVLPLVVDGLHGRESNLYRILTELREQHQPMNKFARSLCYFLTFGSYTTYDAKEAFFGKYSAAGMLDFVTLHWRSYLCWIIALVATPLLFVATRRIAARTPLAAGVAENAVPPMERPGFVAWFWIMTLLACGLTLVWGMKQTGLMYYFNAYFNYSIFFCLALGLAAALAAFLQASLAAPHLRPARVVVGTALALGAVVAALNYNDRFLLPAPDTTGEMAAARALSEAAATLPAGTVCYLDCDPPEIWPVMYGVAVELDREGRTVRFSNAARGMVGERRIVSHEPIDFSRPMVHWCVVEASREPVGATRWPVLDKAILAYELAALDPADGRISFARAGNFLRFACFGWSPSGGDWMWSDQGAALLQFRPLPLPPDRAGGVDVRIDAWSFAPPKAPEAQRVEVVFNGLDLGTVRLPIDREAAEPVRVHIDADQWRAAVARGFGMLSFRFPDAVSPYQLGMHADRRPLAGGFRSVELRAVP